MSASNDKTDVTPPGDLPTRTNTARLILWLSLPWLSKQDLSVVARACRGFYDEVCSLLYTPTIELPPGEHPIYLTSLLTTPNRSARSGEWSSAKVDHLKKIHHLHVHSPHLCNPQMEFKEKLPALQTVTVTFPQDARAMWKFAYDEPGWSEEREMHKVGLALVNSCTSVTLQLTDAKLLEVDPIRDPYNSITCVRLFNTYYDYPDVWQQITFMEWFKHKDIELHLRNQVLCDSDEVTAVLHQMFYFLVFSSQQPLASKLKVSFHSLHAMVWESLDDDNHCHYVFASVHGNLEDYYFPFGPFVHEYTELRALISRCPAPRSIKFVQEAVHWMIQEAPRFSHGQKVSDELLDSVGLIERETERGVYDLVPPS